MKHGGPVFQTEDEGGEGEGNSKPRLQVEGGENILERIKFGWEGRDNLCP